MEELKKKLLGFEVAFFAPNLTNDALTEASIKEIISLIFDFYYLHKEVNTFLEKMIELEIKNTNHVGVLFRLDSFPVRLIVFYLKELEGLPFLQNILKPFVEDLQAQVTKQLNPNLEEDSEIIIQKMSSLLNLIFTQLDTLPKSLKLLFQKIHKEVNEYFPNDLVTPFVLHFFLFKYVGPALTSPKIAHIISNDLISPTKSNVVQFSKLLNDIALQNTDKWCPKINEFISSIYPFIWSNLEKILLEEIPLQPESILPPKALNEETILRSLNKCLELAKQEAPLSPVISYSSPMSPRTAKKQNKAIEKYLKEEQKKKKGEIKLLLLGTSESGKSTIVKQIRNLYMNGYTEDERKDWIPVLHSNVIEVIKDLIEASIKFGYKVQNPEWIKAVKTHPTSILNSELGSIIKNIWEDPAIQSTFDRQNEFQLLDSTEYILSHVERISQSSFVPTLDDLLRARKTTTSICEVDFKLQDHTFKLIDVGGQRTERKKWIHFFEDVTSILFCVALSEYDLTLREDSHTNRMLESLRVFRDILKNKWFTNTPVILFFNKTDLFKEKIQRVDLNVTFPGYKGGKNFTAASEYIQGLFKSQNKKRKKPLYFHFTTATDSNNIRFVFSAVQDIILHRNLEDFGIE